LISVEDVEEVVVMEPILMPALTVETNGPPVIPFQHDVYKYILVKKI
jgi:hypothetical protein